MSCILNDGHVQVETVRKKKSEKLVHVSTCYHFPEFIFQSGCDIIKGETVKAQSVKRNVKETM